MNDHWQEIFKTRDLPKLDQYKKSQSIEALKKEIAVTEIVIKETYLQKMKRYVPFINKTTFVIQFILLLMGLFVIATTTFERTRLILSFVMPVLAFLQMMELQKSFKYSMYEIEMTCKINLKEVISIKLIISTVMNVCIMTIFVFLTGIQFQQGSYLLIIYFLVPFMITNSISMGVSRMLKNKSNEITNISVMILMNIVLFILNMNFPFVYEISSSLIWIAIFILTSIYFIKGIYQCYEKEEDYIWNLQ